MTSHSLVVHLSDTHGREHVLDVLYCLDTPARVIPQVEPAEYTALCGAFGGESTFLSALDGAAYEAFSSMDEDPNDGEPGYDLECGFDVYTGSYTDDC